MAPHNSRLILIVRYHTCRFYQLPIYSICTYLRPRTKSESNGPSLWHGTNLLTNLAFMYYSSSSSVYYWYCYDMYCTSIALRLTLFGLQSHMWGQTTQILRSLSPKRDCSAKTRSARPSRSTIIYPKFLTHVSSRKKCACYRSFSLVCRFVGRSTFRLKASIYTYRPTCLWHVLLIILQQQTINTWWHMYSKNPTRKGV